MSTTITIPFTGKVDAVLQRATAAVRDLGGAFSGDVRAGQFHAPTPVGRVAGGYEVHGNLITVTVSERPFLLSRARIESELRRFFA